MKKTMIATALIMAMAPNIASAKEVWASFYSSAQKTASGERFNPNDLTAAHRTLPIGKHVLVKYKSYSVIVRINDRGPFTRGRELDLSRKSAQLIHCDGVCKVSMTVID